MAIAAWAFFAGALWCFLMLLPLNSTSGKAVAHHVRGTRFSRMERRYLTWFIYQTAAVTIFIAVAAALVFFALGLGA